MRTRQLEERIDGAIDAIASLKASGDDLMAVCETIAAAVRSGRVLYTAGNGGSAAQALHLAEELVGRYRTSRPPLPAVCLNADPTLLTCIANDFGFEQVFARQCQALVRRGDLLLVLSTSGRSANLVAALEVARAAGATTLGLLGRDGGPCRALCDRSVLVASEDSAHVQEAHQVAIHLVCERLEPDP